MQKYLLVQGIVAKAKSKSKGKPSWLKGHPRG
jgi:hypothetical protein